MMVVGVDPGTNESAFVIYDPARLRVGAHATLPNEDMRTFLRERREVFPMDVLVVEQMKSTYRSAVGEETLETIWWAGRFYEIWAPSVAYRQPREAVRKHFAIALKANIRHVGDPEIRAAIYERYGGKEHAMGKKKAPGPLFGVKGHEFAALAVAISWSETNVRT